MDYISINNYSGLGKLGISRKAIASIAEKAVAEVSGATLDEGSPNKLSRFFGLADPIKVALLSEGKARITIDVNVSRDSKVSDICLAIQKEVASELSMACDWIPYDIKVNVKSLI